jgi:hypothetical protein
LIAATSHRGLAPRPAQVSPEGPRYFGATFLPFKVLRRSLPGAARVASLEPTKRAQALKLLFERGPVFVQSFLDLLAEVDEGFESHSRQVYLGHYAPPRRLPLREAKLAAFYKLLRDAPTRSNLGPGSNSALSATAISIFHCRAKSENVVLMIGLVVSAATSTQYAARPRHSFGSPSIGLPNFHSARQNAYPIVPPPARSKLPRLLLYCRRAGPSQLDLKLRSLNVTGCVSVSSSFGAFELFMRSDTGHL